MRKNILSLVALVGPFTAYIAACSGDDSTSPISSDGGGDAMTSSGDGGGGSDATMTPDAAPSMDSGGSDTGSAPDGSDAAIDAGPHGLVRIAWFDDPAYTPALAGAARFDVCLALHGTGNWTGPIFATAGGAGLALGDVTTYFNVPPGQYDARIVAIAADGGAPTCALAPQPDAGAADAGAGDDAGDDGGADGGIDAGPIDAGPSLPNTDFTNLPPIAEGATFTFVFTPPFTNPAPDALADLVPLVDETTTTAGDVGVRFANVSGTAVSEGLDYGLGGGVTFTPWFKGITATERLDPGADTNGYREEPAFTQIDTSLELDGTELGVSDGFDAPSGARISAFAVLTKASPLGVGLVACADGEVNAASPLLSKCNAISTVAPGSPTGVFTRFADFIADHGFPAIDVCVKYDSETSWSGAPVLGADGEDAGSAGLLAGQVSPRLAFHEGFLYDIRVVKAGSTACTAAMTPDVTYTPLSTDSNLVTFALAGYDGAPEDGGVLLSDASSGIGGYLSNLDFVGLTIDDLACNETAPVLRVAHMAAGSPEPLTVTLNGGDAGAGGWTFANVPYGGYLTTEGEDGCGYLGITAETGGVLSVGGTQWSYDVASTAMGTLYLYSSAGQLNLVACDDTAAGGCTALAPSP